MKAIAVQGCILTLTDHTLVPASIKIDTLPSEKTKVGGAYAYRGTLQATVTAIADAAGNVAETAVCKIKPGAKKVKIDGMDAVLEGDESEAVTVTFKHPVTGTEATHKVAVKISDAGQNKAQGA